MKGDLEPDQFDPRMLRTVVVVIVIGLGALAWEWHNAHTSSLKPDRVNAWPYDTQSHEARAAAQPPGSSPSATQ